MDDIKKKVDESWKETVDTEKQREVLGGKQESAIPEVSFASYITSLGLQVMIAMGDAENPVTGKKEESLPHARFIIDTMDMLKEKTKNNITQEESDLLENMLYELKMRYATKQK